MGTEPSNVSMYEYAPDGLPANAPVLVLVHYCSGNASGIFGEAQSGGIVTQADQKKILLLVVPQTSCNCWAVATTASLTHGMASETKAIVDQVKYAITKHNANANRVYVMGASSGAMVTQALLAVYPDVFKAGAEFAGVPAGCWSVTRSRWSVELALRERPRSCTPRRSGATWRARCTPGTPGYRPRIQLWHGSADGTINYANYQEAVDQWTNVLGLPATPTTTGTVTISNHSYNRRQWKNSCGIVVLDAFDEPGGPHGPDANMNGQYPLPFFNLDQATFTATDPQADGLWLRRAPAAPVAAPARVDVAAPPGPVGTTGAAGRGGTSGSAGAGGSTGRGGTTGSGGSIGPGVGGQTGTGGDGSSGSAGDNGSSGQAGTGIVTGTGGDSSSGSAGDMRNQRPGWAPPGAGGSVNPTGAAGRHGTSGSAGTAGEHRTLDARMRLRSVRRNRARLNALALAGIVVVRHRPTTSKEALGRQAMRLRLRSRKRKNIARCAA